MGSFLLIFFAVVGAIGLAISPVWLSLAHADSPPRVLSSAPASKGMTAGVREAAQALEDGGWDTSGRAIVVDIRNQRLLVLKDAEVEKSWWISSSKYGTGSTPRSNKTPLGLHRIWQKSGATAALGQPLKGGEPTDAPVSEESGRKKVYITTRALKLDGLEEHNRTSRSRGIWIHGTSAEEKIGRPASIGCVRMRNVDVVDLFDLVGQDTLVYITDK